MNIRIQLLAKCVGHLVIECSIVTALTTRCKGSVCQRPVPYQFHGVTLQQCC